MLNLILKRAHEHGHVQAVSSTSLPTPTLRDDSVMLSYPGLGFCDVRTRVRNIRIVSVSKLPCQYQLYVAGTPFPNRATTIATSTGTSEFT